MNEFVFLFSWISVGLLDLAALLIIYHLLIKKVIYVHRGRKKKNVKSVSSTNTSE